MFDLIFYVFDYIYVSFGLLCMRRYMSVGPWAGIAACVIAAYLYLLGRLCEYIWPAEDIEKCPDVASGGVLKPL